MQRRRTAVARRRRNAVAPRTKIAVAAAVVAAAGAAVAFTLPSMAGTTPQAGAKSPAATGNGVSPQILAAMQRDLGLNADQSAARLKRAKWASGVSAKLSALTGADFGGSWLAKDGNTLKVAVTDSAAAKQVKAAGGVPVMVKNSEQTLDTAKAKLDAAKSSVKGLTGWYVDVTTNKLVVVAKPGEDGKAQQFAQAAGVKSDQVSVVTNNAQPKPLADLHGADAYFIQSAEGTARCSIGFSVQGGFVSAGHCGQPGDKVFDQNQKPLGAFKASVFPGDADESFVQVTAAGFTEQPFVNDFKGNLLPVAGSTEAPVGAAICRSGSTTGTHCGTIEAKNQTVVYPEGQVTGLTRTNACAEPGDSGGSWLSGDQAQGVTSGGSGDCTSGGETFFQPVNEILARNNLTLLTTGGNAGGGASSTPSAAPTTSAPADNGGGDNTTACDNQLVTRQGSIKGGTAVAEPNGGAFRANAGAQTACLQAAGNADLDLFLQKLSGNRFRTVAQATGDGATKTLAVNARSGIYRYVVADNGADAQYTLGFSAQ